MLSALTMTWLMQKFCSFFYAVFWFVLIGDVTWEKLQKRTTAKNTWERTSMHMPALVILMTLKLRGV